MAHHPQHDDIVTHTPSMQQRFRDICRDLEAAHARRELTALYTRAAYLVRLTHARSWEARFGQQVHALRTLAQEEFATTARQINRRAAQIGITADYDEQWEQEQ